MNVGTRQHLHHWRHAQLQPERRQHQGRWRTGRRQAIRSNFNGGTLLGNGGTITGNVSMSGTISPGDMPGAAGALGITGNYAQTSAGIFQLELGGLTAGSQFDVLNVTGTTSLNGTLDVSLINGFFPAVGDTFTFLTSGGVVSGIFSTVNGLNIGGGEVLQVVYNANNVQIGTLSLAPVNDYWNGGTGNWSNNPPMELRHLARGQQQCVHLLRRHTTS